MKHNKTAVVAIGGNSLIVDEDHRTIGGSGKLSLVTWFVARPMLQKCSVNRQEFLARTFKVGVIPVF